MWLALNLGNTRLQASVFSTEAPFLHEPRAGFAFETSSLGAPAALARRLSETLRAHGVDPQAIERVGAASVVPSSWPTVHEACRLALGREPLPISTRIRTGLKIAYATPETLGADRLAAAMAGAEAYPACDVLIADFGTATTYTALTADGTLRGGLILPGARLALDSLFRGTGQLPALTPEAPLKLIGDSTREALLSGAYYAQLFTLRGVRDQATRELYGGKPPRFIATGGGAYVLAREAAFDAVIPDLVLRGVRRAISLNLR